MNASNPLGTNLGQRVNHWFGTREVWNIRLAVYAGFFFAAANISYDSLRLSSFDPSWLPIWFGTYLEWLALSALMVALAPRRLWSSTRRGVITNLLIAGIAGAVKNTSVYWWAVAVGLETSEYDALIRVFGGAVLSAGILASWVGMSASRLGHLSLMNELRRKQKELLGYREKISQQVSRAQLELISQTKQTLLPKLDWLEARLVGDTDVQSVVIELQNIIEVDVRPLSRAFELEAQQLASSPQPDEAGVRRRSGLPKQFRIRENLPTLPVLLLALPLSAITAYMLIDRAQVAWVTVSSLLTVLAGLIWRIFSPQNRKVGRRFGLLIFSVASASILAPQAILLALTLDTHDSTVSLMIWTVVAQTLLGFWLSAYLRIIDEARVDLEDQMAQINEKLSHELAVFNQALWLQKRRWSYLLHGTVQATLTAAIARLSSLTNSPLDGAIRDTEAGMIRQLVRQDLRKIANAITNPPKPELDLMYELKQLQQTWSGVLDVSFTVSDRAARAIEKNLNMRLALNEICREAATNAYRHGRANILKIVIDRPLDHELTLDITNNGERVTGSAKGLGLQMLDALTLEWHWDERKTTALTTMSARLPLALN